MIGFVTVYIGLWFLTDDLEDEETKILLFALILLSNLIFVFKWLIAYLGAATWAKRCI